MGKIISGIILIILCFFNSSALGSTENRTISFGYPDTGWPPYLLVDNNGIMIDIISTISDTLGYQLIIEILPDKRSQLYLTNGQIDCGPKAREWVDNPEQYYWTDSVITAQDVIIFRKGEFSEIDSLQALGQSEMIIGGILGFKYPTIEPFFSSGKIKRHDLRSPSSLFKALQLGIVDAVVSDKFVAQWLINNDSSLSHDMFHFGPPIAEAEYRFQFSKHDDWRPFIEQFNKEMAKMRKDGRLQEILSKYLMESSDDNG